MSNMWTYSVFPLYVFDLVTGKNEIGPRGVRALPLAAGRNVGGHYKGHFFLFLSFFLLSSGSLLILPEGVVVGIQIFACGPELPIE